MLSYTLSAALALGAIVAPVNAAFYGTNSTFPSGHGTASATFRTSNTITGPSATILVPGTTDSPSYGGFGGHVDFEASIICADKSKTTYALVGTTAGQRAALTITQGASECLVTVSTAMAGTKVYAANSCALHGTTSADCVETVSGSIDGKSASTTVSYAIGAYAISSHYDVFPVTAGASYLTSPAESCTPTKAPGNAAAPTGMAGDIYKVIVVPAAAALAAAII